MDRSQLRQRARRALSRRVPAAVLSGSANDAARYRDAAAILARFADGGPWREDVLLTLREFELMQGASDAARV